MLSYIQTLALLNAHRVLGHTLAQRGSALAPFSSHEREQRASAPGDLVDSMIEGRLVLEKTKILEGRMRYQIEKLVKLAEEAPTEDTLNGTPCDSYIYSGLTRCASDRPSRVPTEPAGVYGWRGKRARR